MGLFNFFLLFSAILVLPFPAPGAADMVSETAALLALRSALGGRLLLWNVSSSPCEWAGVRCSLEGDSIVGLRLPGMGLVGVVPPGTISNLTNLRTLSLRFNSLTGSIPVDMFSSLTLLRNLYLQNNFFSGEIPESLFGLTSLVRLNLANNNFSGSISSSFNNLTRLGTLYLQNNHFSGAVPDLRLPVLAQFDVSDNDLSGQIPAGLTGRSRNSFSGNSLCGGPLDSCDGRNRRSRLPGGAIAAIVIGSLLGLLVIVLLLFCLLKFLAGKGTKPKDGKNGGNTLEGSVETTGVATSPLASAAATEKRVVPGGANKSLTFFGSTGVSFNLEELLKASAEVLGKGTFGTTYKAVLESGVAVAVKRLREVNLGEKEFKEKLEEIGAVNHENLVPPRAYYFNNDEKLLVFDYFPLGSLSALLHGNRGAGRSPLNWETRAAIALGTARGITYLHSQGPSVSHGNIKSSNILLTKSYEARVSDFGLPHIAIPASTPSRVAGYRAPEITDPQKVSQKADVYSFGILLLELLTAKAPANSLTNEEGVDLPRWVRSVVREEWANEVFDLELLRYQNVEEEMVQLLQLAVDCTSLIPDSRPAMAEVTAKVEDLCRRSLVNDVADIEEDAVGASATSCYTCNERAIS